VTQEASAAYIRVAPSPSPQNGGVLMTCVCPTGAWLALIRTAGCEQQTAIMGTRDSSRLVANMRVKSAHRHRNTLSWMAGLAYSALETKPNVARSVTLGYSIPNNRAISPTCKISFHKFQIWLLCLQCAHFHSCLQCAHFHSFQDIGLCNFISSGGLHKLANPSETY
jgi:hypothetical protein